MGGSQGWKSVEQIDFEFTIFLQRGAREPNQVGYGLAEAEKESERGSKNRVTE